jgi:hypothetical protein
MPLHNAHSPRTAGTSEQFGDDLPPWEDVHGDIRRWADPAVRAMMDLAECGPLPEQSYVL